MSENERFLLAHWGGRARTAEQVSRAVLGSVNDLSRIDALLSDWWRSERVPISDEVSVLADYIERRSLNRGHADEGYASVLSSCGTQDSGYSLSFCDGTVKQHPIFLNDVELSPKPTHQGPDALQAHAAAIVEVVVRWWSPDSVALADAAVVAALPDLQRRQPRIGRVMWLAGHLGAVPVDLPDRLPGLRMRPLGAGTLLELPREQGADAPVEDVVRLAELLEEVGLMGDLPQMQPPQAALAQ